MVKFLFSVHTIILLPKQSRAIGRAGARTVDLLARSFDLARPGVAPPLVLQTALTVNFERMNNAVRYMIMNSPSLRSATARVAF